ncbi:glycine--tRNA ligase [Candidatus Woesearchaeota archaeon]|nr:glycine--tRNA ligase [Candidatus Woesearchaeota archaeon]
MTNISIEDMAKFCKRKGFVYQSAEIYGGLSGFFDFGHMGVELKNNIKQEWWEFHVKNREDIVGIDGAVITNPKVWQASGHAENFEDLMLTCTKCREKIRADTFIEDSLKTAADGMRADEINNIVRKNKLKCPKCNSGFEDVREFNLMFNTGVGPKEDSSAKAYLRPETAQLIFTNFRLVADNSRLKLPFGIAQTGKAFRNEISPRDFLFRCREFEQMEIEYFVHPDKAGECPFIDEAEETEMLVYSAEMQERGLKPKKMKIKDALDKKIIKTGWHAYWLVLGHKWFTGLGAKPGKFRIRQHLKKEMSHYASDTWDLEYEFPFGWKELQGVANRADFDLRQHMKHSKKDLSLFDEESKEKIVPHVIAEPSLGVERALLVFLYDAYEDDKERGNIVLHLHPKLAPIKIGVFPLVNKLKEDARKLYNELKNNFSCIYDKTGSIGRRYARADEIGIPYCITFDFDSLKDNSVTIRDRETTKQKRIKISDLKKELVLLLS